MTEKNHKIEKPIHVRVFYPPHPFKIVSSVREHYNPHAKDKDADFIRRSMNTAQFVEQVESKVEELSKKLEAIEKRLVDVEDFIEEIVRPIHAKENLKKQKEHEQDIRIEEIAKMQGEERKSALKRFILGKEGERK